MESPTSHHLVVFWWLESTHSLPPTIIQGEGFTQEAGSMAAVLQPVSPSHPTPLYLCVSLKEETNFHMPLRRNASQTERPVVRSPCARQCTVLTNLQS